MDKQQIDVVAVNVDKLEEWHLLLKADGINSKAVVREEIKNLLNEIKEEKNETN